MNSRVWEEYTYLLIQKMEERRTLIFTFIQSMSWNLEIRLGMTGWRHEFPEVIVQKGMWFRISLVIFKIRKVWDIANNVIMMMSEFCKYSRREHTQQLRCKLLHYIRSLKYFEGYFVFIVFYDWNSIDPLLLHFIECIVIIIILWLLHLMLQICNVTANIIIITNNITWKIVL